MIQYDIQIGNTVLPLVFPLISALDHNSNCVNQNLTGKVLLAANSGNFFVANGAITEKLDNVGAHTGIYQVAANATDAATEGLLSLHIYGTAQWDAQDMLFEVVNYNPLELPASVWAYGQRTVTGAPPVVYAGPPMPTPQQITISRRYAYLTAYGLSLQWNVSSPSLAGTTPQLAARSGVVWSVIAQGTFTGAVPNQNVTIPLSNAVVQALSVGDQEFSFEAVDGSGNIIPLQSGTLTVTD